jgi:uncharacterized protein
MQKAKRIWESAQRIAAIGDYEAATNRLYYAAFHAALAACLTEGLEPKSHRGLSNLLKLHFVETGKLPEWTHGALSRLQSERDLADYAPSYTLLY